MCLDCDQVLRNVDFIESEIRGKVFSLKKNGGGSLTPLPPSEKLLFRMTGSPASRLKYAGNGRFQFPPSKYPVFCFQK